MSNLRWLPIDVRIETGTKAEILRLPGNHACCGTILRAAVLNPKRKQTWLYLLIIMHALQNLRNYQREILAIPPNYTKDCTPEIDREKLKSKRRNRHPGKIPEIFH